MSALTVEDKHFVPASTAGESVGYTADYITKLAREGKLVASRVGRQWYVTPESVLLFKARTEEEKRIRGEEIRRERLAEQKSYHQHTAPEPILEIPDRRLVAITETLLIVVIGLSIGVSGHFLTTGAALPASLHTANLNSLERFALVLYEFFTPERNEKEKEEESERLVVTPPTTVAQDAGAPQAEKPQSLIVAPVETFTEAHAALVTDSFSDEVSISIDPDNPDTGIIIPKFKSRDGSEFRFLMVPVDTSPDG